MQVTNNKVICAADVGIRLYKTATGLISCNVTVAGNYVRYAETGILVSYQAGGTAGPADVRRNSIQDASVEAIRVESTSPNVVEHVNVSGNNVNGFAAGIVLRNCHAVRESP